MAEDKTIGARRNRSDKDEQLDIHATGKATRGNEESDIHTTSKASRRIKDDDIHTTSKAARGRKEEDIYSTAKANRDNLQPFEQKTQGARRLSNNAEAKSSGSADWPSEFELDGVKYKNEGILSDSSGEAVVFTVSRNGKKYALKVYYYDPDHRPNHKILEKIKKLGGSGLLVNIISHGEWKNPNSPEEINDYELMDFCEGGSLEDVIIAGDEKALAEVAVKMGAAIDFLSKHGIIHRDIKPANFFYADKAKTQIVLADFGISAECPEGGTCKIDEMRSPLYASPEFYTNVPGQPAEVGVESDYFSLGVSLLCLWVGKAKLSANESQLLRSKLNETLPIPKDMSAHAASLIKGLTRLKMADRANFEDIKRWVQGDNLDTAQNEAIDSDFHVVYNSSKNQVAHSPAELASFLVEDKSLGKKYIYSGRVTRWLEETGRNEIAVNVEEIVEKLYPKNQDAGLMAVAYMLDPAMDYEAPDGKRMTDPAEIAVHIFDDKLVDEVTNPESNLMVYLKTLKLDKTVAAVTDYVSSGEIIEEKEPWHGFMASYYLAVLLNNQVGFPVDVDSKLKIVNNVEELLEAYHDNSGLGKYNNYFITSRAFITWLSYRNPALAGKVRMLHDNSNDDKDSIYYNSDSGYRIAYELDPACDLYFSTDQDDPERCYTIEEIGLYLNISIQNYVNKEETDELEALDDIVYMDDSIVGDYLRARGEQYANFLKWNRYCMDLDDEENNQKAGPYDLLIGAFKSLTGFIGEAPTLTLGDKNLDTIDDLKQLSQAEIADALNDTSYDRYEEDDKVSPLAAWLTVFFQENPKLDLSQKYTYEKETAKYIEFIGKYAPNNYYVKRYNSALKVIDKSATKLQKSDHSTKLRKNIYLAVGGVLTLALLLCMIFFQVPEVNPIKGHYLATAGLLFIAILVPCIASDNSSEGLMWGVIGGFGGAWLLSIGFKNFPAVVTGILGIAALIAAIYYAKSIFTTSQSFSNGGNSVKDDEFEYRQLDALYFAYHQTDNKLDNVITKFASMQRSSNKIMKEEYNKSGWSWIGITLPLLVLWYFITPQLSGASSWSTGALESKAKENQWILGTWKTKYASGSTSIVCNIDSINKHNEIFGTMEIAGQAPVQARGTMKSDSDTIPDKFSMWPIEEGTKSKKCLNFKYKKDRKMLEGTYYDRNGSSHNMTFLSTPLAPWFLDEKDSEVKNNNTTETKKSSKSNKSSKSSKSSKPAETEQASEPEQTSEQEVATEPAQEPEREQFKYWKDTM